MKFRYATDEDSQNIRDVIFSVLKEYGLKPDPYNTDKDLYHISEEYFRNKGMFSVVEKQNAIIATVGIRRVSDSTCELRKMYCLSEYRGQGIGKLLLDYAIDHAKQLGYKKMTLETASVLKEAIILYKKYGFREYSSTDIVPRCDMAFQLSLTD